MLFNVATLLQSPVGEFRRYSLPADPPVHHGRVTLTRTPHGVLVQMQATVIIDTSCSRCLVPFGYPADIEMEEVFRQQVDPSTGRHIAPEDAEEAEEDSFQIGLDHVIDTTEAVRQYVLMAMAMQPLCRPDCPGICAQCGTDLNLSMCDCDRTPTDPRWSALAALKQTIHG
jgi:uncharacterized protein